MTDEEEASPDVPEEPQRPNWLARLVTAISALLICALLGVIAWDAVHPDLPPAPGARTATLRQLANHMHIGVEVLNAGDMAARDVLVRVALTTPDTTIDDEITIDWLPGRSRREVTVIIPFVGQAPRVTAEVQGFVTP
jgi:uncharacterized protein (TIGR02588 family)